MFPKIITMFAFLLCISLVSQNVIANSQNVYEHQAPIKEEELLSFIKLLPQFKAWVKENNDYSHPSVVNNKADFIYSEGAAVWAKTNGFEPRRFFFCNG